MRITIPNKKASKAKSAAPDERDRNLVRFNVRAPKKKTSEPDNSAHELVRFQVFDEKGRHARVKVGGIVVVGDKASRHQVKHSVAQSAEMLGRFGETIVQPGVRLPRKRNVPLFSVDPTRPDRFIRKLNGKVDRGILVDGSFQVMD